MNDDILKNKKAAHRMMCSLPRLLTIVTLYFSYRNQLQ